MILIVAASGMTITKARSEKVLFSSPYYENALAVVYKDGTTVNSLDDLKGKNCRSIGDYWSRSCT